MAITNPARRFAPRGLWQAHGPQLAFGAAILVAFVASMASHRMLPGELVMPAICMLLFVLAALAALAGSYAGRTPRHERLSYWDVAGALALVGIFASVLVDPDQLLRLLESGRREK
jgi:hypothetical protein